MFPTHKKLLIRRCPGWTFVEILVAVSILAVLMTLLVPLGNRLVESGRETACLSKLRNLGVAHRIWRNDHDDRLAPSTTELEWRPSRHLYEGGVITSAEEMGCPAVTSVDKGAWHDVTQNWGGDYQAAFYRRPISYGINTLAFNQTTPKGWGSARTTTYRMFIGKESYVPLFFDAKAWQANSTVWSEMPLRLARFAFPHNQRSHVLFLDGHVEKLDRDGVSQLHPLGEVGTVY